MAVPLSHKIKRHRFKLLIFLCIVALFYHFYLSQYRDTIIQQHHVPVIIDQIHQEPPRSSAAETTKERILKDPAKATAKLDRKPKKLPPLPPLPPHSDSEDDGKHPKFKPLRGDEKGIFTKYTDEEYETLEIIMEYGPGTRMGNKGKLELLPPVILPRKVRFPVDSVKQLPKPDASWVAPRVQAEKFEESESEKTARLARLQKVKETFMISWNQYKKFAWGRDEIKPVSQEAFDPFAGWAATLVDALDTLLIMGLKDEFKEAIKVLEKISFATTFRKDIPLFETVIRYLGGLLAAYDLSKEPILLSKAIELGDNLMGAFDTPNHMPQVSFLWTEVDSKFRFRASSLSSFAEIGSLSVEFTRLAQLTGNSTYYDAVDRITTAIYELAPKNGIPYLFPSNLDASGCDVFPIRQENKVSEEKAEVKAGVSHENGMSAKETEVKKAISTATEMSAKETQVKTTVSDHGVSTKKPQAKTTVSKDSGVSAKETQVSSGRRKISSEKFALLREEKLASQSLTGKLSKKKSAHATKGKKGMDEYIERALDAYSKVSEDAHRKFAGNEGSQREKRELFDEDSETIRIIKGFGHGRSAIANCRKVPALMPMGMCFDLSHFLLL